MSNGELSLNNDNNKISNGIKSGKIEIRCPRNSKNNDGKNCYCHQYVYNLYHGVANKSVICCYANGECCYQKNCGYSHIDANILPMPCIFELNNRRCNNPSKCIFKLSYHSNRRKPKTTEQVYRYDNLHRSGQLRFPRSKRVIDKDFDLNNAKKHNYKKMANNNNNNNNTGNVQIQTVFVPIPYNTGNNDNISKNKPNKNEKKFIDLCGIEGLEEKKDEFDDNYTMGSVGFYPINTDTITKTQNNTINNTDLKKDYEKEIELEISLEIEKKKEEFKQKGRTMPFTEKVKIKRQIRQKYENMQKELNKNNQYTQYTNNSNKSYNIPKDSVKSTNNINSINNINKISNINKKRDIIVINNEKSQNMRNIDGNNNLVNNSKRRSLCENISVNVAADVSTDSLLSTGPSSEVSYCQNLPQIEDSDIFDTDNESLNATDGFMY